MRIVIMLALIVSSINLTACSSMSGNVVPEKGPTMENVYDSMEKTNTNILSSETSSHSASILPSPVVHNEFHKLSNPELLMTVYPHLAGNDEVPIPGYDTVFNAYTQDHYTLPNETVRA